MNVTNTFSATQISSEVMAFRYFGISIAVFTIFVGGIGNTLTILAYTTNKKFQTIFNTFVVNLSFIDLFTATLMLPFNLAGYVQLKWPFGNDSFTTRLQAFSYFSCGYTSITFLVAITINRFIGILSPTRYRFVFCRKRMISILIFCWTFAPICLLPFLVGTNSSCMTPNKALTGFYKQQLLCTFICFPDGEWYVYMQIVRVMFQFLPLGIMVVAYTTMFLHIRYRREKLALSTLANVSNNVPSSTLITITPAIRRKESRLSQDFETRKNKSANLLLLVSVVVCIAFVITFLPSVIINLFPQRSLIDTRWHMAASNLSWFNSGLNPIIYAILNSNFRKEYIRIIRAMINAIKVAFHLDSSSTSNSLQSKTHVSSGPPIRIIVNGK